MPEVEGHIFPPYVFSEWPKFVRRSDGSHLIAESQEAIDAFLDGDLQALAVYRREEAMTAEHRAADAAREQQLAKMQQEIEQERQQRLEAYAAAHEQAAMAAHEEQPRDAATGQYRAREAEHDGKPGMKA